MNFGLLEHSKFFTKILTLGILLFITGGCNTQTQITPTLVAEPFFPPPTAFPSPMITLTMQPTSTRTLSTASVTPSKLVCSPLEAVGIAQLSEFISNPFNPPVAGSDLPHQGIDYSIVSQDSGFALDGNPVHAVLSGKVTTVIKNRFPYGNAVIIETVLSTLNPPWLQTDIFMTPSPINNHILTCPSWESVDNSLRSEGSNDPTISDLSIYVLYAHLQEQVPFAVGDPVICGQSLGRIGQSGNALNPHLHLEMRVGPGNAQFLSMAHYDTSATEIEMANYCAWRISGSFHLIDPQEILILAIQE